MHKSYDLKGPFKNGEAIYCELKEDLRKVVIDGEAIKEDEVEEKLNALLDWLETCPKHTCIRVNTQKTNAEMVSQKIKNYIEQETGRLPILSMEAKMPEVILIHSWDKSNLDLSQYEREVIVDSICGEFVLKGAPIYGPGILAMPHGLSIGDKVSVFADKSGHCLKGSYKYNDRNRVFLGNGILKQTRHSLFGSNLNVRGIAVYMTDLASQLPPIHVNDFLKCEAMPQHLPCVICTYVLNPQPGEIILDMCAAPGNKTTHISNFMKGEGTVIALDVNKRKIETMKEKCRDYSSNNIKIFCYNAKKAFTEKNDLLEEGPPFGYGTFDRILLDPPCSGLGQRPQILNKISLSEMRSFRTLQQMLFKSVVRLLKPGGTLVYSTCTITVSENEEIVSWALQMFECLKLKSVRRRFHVEGYGAPGYSIAGLTEEQANDVYRFGPESDSIGFFIACFEKSLEQDLF